MPYENSKLMHQFYRDILCDDIRLPEFGNVPPEWVRNFINARHYNVLLKAEQIHKLNTGLEPTRDRALKLMLTTLEQSKLASDYFAQGISIKMPRAYLDSILDTLHEILKLNPNVNYFVTGLQLMYRIGAIDEFMAAVSRYPDLPTQFSSVAIIKAMIHMMEGEFDAARDLLKTTDAKNDRNSIVQLMRMTCEFKLGGTPRSPIDFSPLQDAALGAAPGAEIDWLRQPDGKGRSLPTVVIACDEKYFFEHAVPLVCSTYATNVGRLALHLHCYNPSGSVTETITDLNRRFPELQISASREAVADGPAMKVPYACNRFVIAPLLLDYFSAPILVLDADMLLRKRWDESEWPQDVELVLTGNTGKSPFWERFLGGFVYARPGEVARKYLSAVARFVRHNIEGGNHVWFLDQIALSACFEATTQIDHSVAFVDPRRVYDRNHSDDSLIWTVTTVKEGRAQYAAYRSEVSRLFGTQGTTG